MPKPEKPRPENDHITKLPDAAWDHMSNVAQGYLPDLIQPPVNVIWIDVDSNAVGPLYSGTFGSADVFVFDLAAQTAPGYWYFAPFIDNFEAELDTLAFINVPEGTTILATSTIEQFVFNAIPNYGAVAFITGQWNAAFQYVGGNNDPALADLVLHLPQTPGIDDLNNFVTLWDVPETYNLSISSDNTVTLVGGQQMTLPPDPYL